jgi:hypothetical protein
MAWMRPGTPGRSRALPDKDHDGIPDVYDKVDNRVSAAEEHVAKALENFNVRFATDTTTMTVLANSQNILEGQVLLEALDAYLKVASATRTPPVTRTLVVEADGSITETDIRPTTASRGVFGGFRLIVPAGFQYQQPVTFTVAYACLNGTAFSIEWTVQPTDLSGEVLFLPLFMDGALPSIEMIRSIYLSDLCPEGTTTAAGDVPALLVTRGGVGSPAFSISASAGAWPVGVRPTITLVSCADPRYKAVVLALQAKVRAHKRTLGMIES